MNNLSRVYLTSKWRSIPSERVDARKHGNRPSLGCVGQFSSRKWRWDATFIRYSSDRMDSQEYEDRSSLWHWCRHGDRNNIEVLICFKTAQPLVFESWAELTSTWENRCKPKRNSIEPRRDLLSKQDHNWSPQLMLSSDSVLERKWIDIETFNGPHDQKCD